MRAISNRQNPSVRIFRELSEEPDRAGVLLLLDGVHLVREARAAGIAVDLVAVAASELEGRSEEGQLAHALESEGVEVIAVSDAVLAAISPVRTPSGIVAIARRTPTPEQEIYARPDAFVLAATDVQDPGNVGALLRTAEAGGMTGAVVCGASATPFSWKAVRGSMGSVLRLPVAGPLDPASVLHSMRTSGLRMVAAVAAGGDDPDAVDWTGRVGLWIGGEGPGLSDAIINACDGRVTIPMAPPVESLNVAVATAILVYAARRQRT
jgi:TrmH family RNA methyltransferase